MNRQETLKRLRSGDDLGRDHPGQAIACLQSAGRAEEVARDLVGSRLRISGDFVSHLPPGEWNGGEKTRHEIIPSRGIASRRTPPAEDERDDVEREGRKALLRAGCGR